MIAGAIGQGRTESSSSSTSARPLPAYASPRPSSLRSNATTIPVRAIVCLSVCVFHVLIREENKCVRMNRHNRTRNQPNTHRALLNRQFRRRNVSAKNHIVLIIVNINAVSSSLRRHCPYSLSNANAGSTFVKQRTKPKNARSQKRRRQQSSHSEPRDEHRC